MRDDDHVSSEVYRSMPPRSHQSELREALDAANPMELITRQTLGYLDNQVRGSAPELVLISPEIKRRWSLPPSLRKLSRDTLPQVLGGLITAGLIALILLVWNHVI